MVHRSWFAALVTLGLLGATPGLAQPLTGAVNGPRVGEAAPAFDLTSTDGKRLTLEAFRGRTLVLNVWGSWCPPCRLEQADLIETAQLGRKDGVAFLGVDTTETADVVRAFAIAKGVPYPEVATTTTSDFARDYAIRNYPTTIVIDPHGIVRAVHADNILPRAQLRAYIAAARDGRSAPLVSDFQRKLDALLDPSGYAFNGDAATVLATVRRAAKAIADADDLQDDAMTDVARDHDLVRTAREQATLRDAAIAALEPLATAPANAALLARLRGDRALATGAWNDADTAYRAALAIDPNDSAALGGAAYAAAQLGDTTRVATLDAARAALTPSTAAFITLGRALAKTGDKTATYTALDRGIALAQTPIDRAWAHLYSGRTALVLGDTARASSDFRAASAAATQIAPRDPHYAWYLEQAQEATIALNVGANAKPSVSIAPWTGPDLPGSIPSTAKYRLAVTGKPGTQATISASGLPRRWIGSFCTDRVCAPSRTTFALPASGVKIVEFQVVPDDDASAKRFQPTVSISLRTAAGSATTSTRVEHA